MFMFMIMYVIVTRHHRVMAIENIILQKYAFGINLLIPSARYVLEMFIRYVRAT